MPEPTPDPDAISVTPQKTPKPFSLAFFQAAGKKGGSTRARNLTPEQRKEASRLAGLARARKAGWNLRPENTAPNAP
jgi:hypothetical protein